MNYSVNIKYLRKKHRLTQDELAKKLGVKRHTICDWESGRTEPNITYLKCLSQVFNVTVDYILGVKSIDTKSEYSSVNRYFAETNEERDLILSIKSMNAEKQKVFLKLLSNLVEFKEIR